MEPHYYIILDTLVQYRHFAYAIIFVAMLLEGDIFLFTAGFIASQKILSFEKLLFVVVVSTLLGDLLWYELGRWIDAKSISWRIRAWVERVVNRFDDHLRTRSFRTLAISKFTYGFGRAMLVRAGMLNLGYAKFLKNDWAAGAVWIILVGGLGYVSGASFGLGKRYLHFAEYALVAGLVLFIIIERLVLRKSLKKQL